MWQQVDRATSHTTDTTATQKNIHPAESTTLTTAIKQSKQHHSYQHEHMSKKSLRRRSSHPYETRNHGNINKGKRIQSMKQSVTCPSHLQSSAAHYNRDNAFSRQYSKSPNAIRRNSTRKISVPEKPDALPSFATTTTKSEATTYANTQAAGNTRNQQRRGGLTELKIRKKLKLHVLYRTKKLWS